MADGFARASGRTLTELRTADDISSTDAAVLAATFPPEDVRALFGLDHRDTHDHAHAADAFLIVLAESAGPEALAVVFGDDPVGAQRGLTAVRHAGGRVIRVDPAQSSADGVELPAAISILQALARQRARRKALGVDSLRVRLRQQAAIAQFGALALRSDDLDALLQQACSLVARGLGVRRSKILEQLPDGRGLLVRAGVGWEPGVVGQAVIGGEDASSPGYALMTGEPVISEDLRRETRFKVPELLRRHGIVSSVNVLIRSVQSRFVVLEVDSTEVRLFGRDDINFLQNCANLVAAAIDRLQTSRELQRALGDKQVLLYELQHRVKNSLQEVASLVGIERRKITDPVLRQPLDVLQSRLEALGIVYRRLYLADRHAEVELGGYLAELTSELVSFHSPDPGAITLDLDLHPLLVALDVALPMALVACEFVVNSCRHAFPDGTGRIGLSLHAGAEDRGHLILTDDGVGLPSADTGRGKGWGLRLIARLVDQVGGDLRIENGHGVRMTIVFPRLKDTMMQTLEGPGP